MSEVKKGKYKEYLYKVGQYVNVTLKIVEQIRIPKGKYTQKGYLVQSVVYPNAEPYEIDEYSLKRGRGCAYKAGKRVCEENSLWSVETIRPYVNKDDALKVTTSSHAKIKTSCKNCRVEKFIQTVSLVNKGMSCNCTKGVSYGNLAFNCYQEHFNLGYSREQTLEELPNRRFDFVNFNTFQIVEVHGLQHYQEIKGVWKDSHKNAVESDKAKRAFVNNPSNPYSLIELDMRVSSWEQFKQTIEQSTLPNITDESEKSILELMELSKCYDIPLIKKLYLKDRKTTYEIADMLQTSNVQIGNILRRNNIKVRNSSERKQKSVRCIETRIVYKSGSIAGEQTGIANSNISKVCNGKLKTAGGYHWEYVDNE